MSSPEVTAEEDVLRVERVLQFRTAALMVLTSRCLVTFEVESLDRGDYSLAVTEARKYGALVDDVSWLDSGYGDQADGVCVISFRRPLHSVPDEDVALVADDFHIETP